MKYDGRTPLMTRAAVPFVTGGGRGLPRIGGEFPCDRSCASRAGGATAPPGSPWSVRVACGTGDRPAVEVHAGESLVDVVASSLGCQFLRGVLGGRRREVSRPCVGLPSGRGRHPSWNSSAGASSRRPQPAHANNVASRFCLAVADGRFARVAAARSGTRESCRVLAVSRRTTNR